MKLGVMFRDAAESLFRKPNTRFYPFERTEAPEKYRGRLIWDQASCTGCGLCVMDCPALAIEMHALDKKAKRFVFTYHAERCTFCAQCVYSCRQGSLSLSSTDWEMAALSKEPFTTYAGAEADVALVRSGSQS